MCALPGWMKTKLLWFSSEQSEEADTRAAVLIYQDSKLNVLKDARVAELVDAIDSKSIVGNNMRVRFSPRALFAHLHYLIYEIYYSYVKKYKRNRTTKNRFFY